MSRTKGRFSLSSLVTGMFIGAGFVMLQEQIRRRSPELSLGHMRIKRALDRTLLAARKQGVLPLEDDKRYIIFSDHHKGNRDRADDFWQCEKTYLAALDHYYDKGYTLVILGDAEELWKEAAQSVIEAYANVLHSEARFHPQRYIRIHGNHDNLWEDRQMVKKYLDRFFPEIDVKRGMVFQYLDDSGVGGEIFMVHGHQGTLDADFLDFFPPIVLPYFRYIQYLNNLGKVTPSQDDKLRAEHDTKMYRWASNRRKLIFIAGHTHRPVWSSTTQVEKLTWQLQNLLGMEVSDRPGDYDSQVSNLIAEIERSQGDQSFIADTIKTKPCYFNTGCCRFADGSITGIELEADSIRLIKWDQESGEYRRKLLDQASLSVIFAVL
jgi:UDP-2,3-diacylglucosamine pyrophosphatase LpxH